MNHLDRETLVHGTMMDSESIANLRVRLAQAEAHASQLRQLGSQEKYLESCFLVEALESQLEELQQEQRVHTAA
jgi:hypothetical protein